MCVCVFVIYLNWRQLAQLLLQLDIYITEAPARLREVADPSVQGSYAFESLKTAFQITVNCLVEDPSKRPSIEDVLWHMQYSIQVQEGWTTSGNLNSGNLSGNLENQLVKYSHY